MIFDFLKRGTAQSTMRVTVFMIAVAVCLNLMALPVLMYVAIKAGQQLTWLGGYLLGLAGVSSAGMAGKVLQTKYENEKPAE